MIAQLLLFLSIRFINIAKWLIKNKHNEENTDNESGKNYQLNYHNETIAKRKYELSKDKDKLKKFIAQYANKNEDVLFKENLYILNELNKIYKASNLINFTDFFKYAYYFKPEVLECFHMLLTEVYLDYDEENDKLIMRFGFGMAGLDTTLDNVVVLKGHILDEFCNKTEDKWVVFNFPKDGPKGEEEKV